MREMIVDASKRILSVAEDSIHMLLVTLSLGLKFGEVSWRRISRDIRVKAQKSRALTGDELESGNCFDFPKALVGYRIRRKSAQLLQCSILILY